MWYLTLGWILSLSTITGFWIIFFMAWQARKWRQLGQSFLHALRFLASGNGLWVVNLLAIPVSLILWVNRPGQGFLDMAPPSSAGLWLPKTHWWFGWFLILAVVLVIFSPFAWGDDIKSGVKDANDDRLIRQAGNWTARGIAGLIEEGIEAVGGGSQPKKETEQPPQTKPPAHLTEGGVVRRVLAIEGASEVAQYIGKRLRGK